MNLILNIIKRIFWIVILNFFRKKVNWNFIKEYCALGAGIIIKEYGALGGFMKEYCALGGIIEE